MDTTLVTVFDTTRMVVVDTVMIGGSLTKDWADYLLPLITTMITAGLSLLIGWSIAKKTAKATVHAEGDAAEERMKSLTDSLAAELGPNYCQIYFVNKGNETIHNAIGYIEIEDVDGRVWYKEDLDESKNQRAWVDDESQLSKNEKGEAIIRTPLCWSMREYVGGDVGTRNPEATNIRPGERRSLDVFAVRTKVKEEDVIQIPSEFGYSTMSSSNIIKSHAFLKLPEKGKGYKATITFFSDNTRKRQWTVEIFRLNDESAPSDSSASKQPQSNSSPSVRLRNLS